MFSAANDFWRSKMTWTGLSGIALAWYQAYTHVITVENAIVATFASLAFMFVRDTVAKAGNIGSTAERPRRG